MCVCVLVIEAKICQYYFFQAFRMPIRLSTSQVPSNLGHLELDLIPESITGGFGPTCDNGYGVLYVSVGENMCKLDVFTSTSNPGIYFTSYIYIYIYIYVCVCVCIELKF